MELIFDREDVLIRNNSVELHLQKMPTYINKSLALTLNIFIFIRL